MINSPIVSIVIPTYNRAHLIEDSIKSILAQTYSNWELLIVDDGSTDETIEVINPYLKDKRIRYVSRPTNRPKGANACRNYGMSIARGKYVKWMDSDDLLIETCLEIQVKELEDNSADVNFCGSQLFIQQEDEIQIINRKWSPKNQSKTLALDLVHGKLRWPVLAGLWLKSILKEAPFNERLQNSQEWLFHIEAALCPQRKFNFTSKALCLIRVQEGSMSHSSNATGQYYFHSSLARYYAISLLYLKKFNRNSRYYLLRKFGWYHLFTLYKGNIRGFFLLMKLWPKIVYKTFY